MTYRIRLYALFIILGMLACEDPSTSSQDTIIAEQSTKDPEVNRLDAQLEDAQLEDLDQSISSFEDQEAEGGSTDGAPLDRGLPDMEISDLDVDQETFDMDSSDMGQPQLTSAQIVIDHARYLKNNIYLEVTPPFHNRFSDAVCRIDRPTEFCQVIERRSKSQTLDLSMAPPSTYLISVLITEEVDDDREPISVEVSCGGQVVTQLELPESETDDLAVWDLIELHLPSCEVTLHDRLNNARCDTSDNCTCLGCVKSPCSPDDCSPSVACDLELGCQNTCGDSSCLLSEHCDSESLSCSSGQCTPCARDLDCLDGYHCIDDLYGQGHCHLNCQNDQECAEGERCVARSTPYVNGLSVTQTYCINEVLYCDSIECQNNSECPEDRLCHQGRCVSCIDQSNCSGTHPVCSPRGECVECLISQDCPNRGECLDQQCILPGADRSISEWSRSEPPSCGGLLGSTQCTPDEICTNELNNGDCILECGPNLLCPENTTCCNQQCYPNAYIPLTCAELYAPVLREARAAFNTTLNTLGVSMTGTDESPSGADVLGGEMTLYGENGRIIYGESFPANFRVSVDDINPSQFTLTHTDFWDVDYEQPIRVAVRAFDQRNLWSQQLIVPIGSPVDINDGTPCDPYAAFNLCPSDRVCLSGTCTPPEMIEYACPTHWDVPELLIGTTVNGNQSDSDIIGEGSCGGDGPSDVYRFTAPSTSTYHFIVSDQPFSNSQTSGDPLIYLRSYCSALVPQLERGCNDDHIDYNSGLAVDLTADETIYLFVDSFQGDSTGPYQLTVAQGDLPPGD